MNGQYDDIIHLPHPDSPKHPRMSLYDRAAQFSPFAALTGHSGTSADVLANPDGAEMCIRDRS